jgi:predicted dehydrogenase
MTTAHDDGRTPLVIIGAGNQAGWRLNGLVGSKRVKVVGAVEPIADQREKFRTNPQHPYNALLPLYESLEAFQAAHPNVRYALVCTPHHTHREVAEQLLRAGFHVLVEKPQGMNVDEVLSMYRVADETGNTLTVGYQYVTGLRKALQFVADGGIGTLMTVTMKWRRRQMYDLPPSFWKHPRSGALPDLGSHGIAAVLRAVGGDFVTVTAHGWNYHGRERVGEDFAAPDGFDAFIRTDKGVVLHFNVRWFTHTRQDEVTILFEGTKGTLLVRKPTWGNSPDPFVPELSVQEPGGNYRDEVRWDMLPLPTPQAYRAEVEAFVAGEPAVGRELAVRTQTVIDRIGDEIIAWIGLNQPLTD